MSENETENVIGLKKTYGFYLNRILEEYERIKSINSDNHNHSSLGLFDFNSNNNANNIFLNNNLDSNFNSLFGNNIARSNNLFRNPNNNSNRTHGLFINFCYWFYLLSFINGSINWFCPGI